MAAVLPSWISERKYFSNPETPCRRFDASHHIPAQIRPTVSEEMSFEEFQGGRHGGHLGYRNGTILAILNLYFVAMPPINFYSLHLMAWEEMSFEESQDGRCHLGYRNGTILAILNLYFASMPPINFYLIQLMAWEEMPFEESQDGRRHLGYRNGPILAILNLYVTLMPPFKFRLNPTYGFWGDVVRRISRWPPFRPS